MRPYRAVAGAARFGERRVVNPYIPLRHRDTTEPLATPQRRVGNGNVGQGPNVALAVQQRPAGSGVNARLSQSNRSIGRRPPFMLVVCFADLRFTEPTR